MQFYSYAACPYTLNGSISPNPKSLIRKKENGIFYSDDKC